ncbi:TRAP transporter substrate-binding protein [Variovorax sp. J22G21]|uniref:TRAP transporter substrate-binding protein n=1 Tax=Variovorax fucosicus TaxID=3053517 RepID=UPI0025752433|nr:MULTISPECIES: TRAP transporter substrate-binding protein [unclassified Variovorax]MDM0040443.1 TRAP transporter substrate-binding protein [Variovorax sp. J22R193]MDM0058561.1 TRAP transporter substrate-binding protein [Variovorax sp. J22G47]MDM0061816.1 TRAP transporter substrate-binding protein [Variovorax sp. J22G21]
MNHKFSIALAGLTLAATSFAQTKWDLPTAYPATNYHTENIAQFAKDVDAATGGKVKITVHANASLFKAPEIKRAVQSGQAQAGEILLANFANENPIYALDGVPFLATTYPEAKKLYAASKPAMEKLLAAQGIKVLFMVPWAPQGIYSKKEIGSVADLRGIKWRAYSPATAKIAELIGAQPVQIQQAELSAAMATGVIESYMSSGSTGYDTKTYESIKNFYDTQAWIPKNAILVNAKSFDALDAPTKAAVLKAAADAEVRGWKTAEEKNTEYKRLLTERGMKIHKPSAKLDADMRQVGGIMQADWLKVAGADGAAIVEAYKK